jgi:hypothetical protein
MCLLALRKRRVCMVMGEWEKEELDTSHDKSGAVYV